MIFTTLELIYFERSFQFSGIYYRFIFWCMCILVVSNKASANTIEPFSMFAVLRSKLGSLTIYYILPATTRILYIHSKIGNMEINDFVMIWMFVCLTANSMGWVWMPSPYASRQGLEFNMSERSVDCIRFFKFKDDLNGWIARK